MRIVVAAFERDMLLQNPETHDLVRALLVDEFVLVATEDQCNEIRDACSDLLQRVGFDEEYAPTPEGRALEVLIDKLFIK